MLRVKYYYYESNGKARNWDLSIAVLIGMCTIMSWLQLCRFNCLKSYQVVPKMCLRLIKKAIKICLHLEVMSI